MGYSRLFRSRWAALLWSAGVVWSAVTFVGAGSADERPPDNQQGDLNQIQALVDKLGS